jgi:anhydro-N-acetylmuramic acid kinase
VPVLTDFSRHNFIAGGPGVLPTSAGNQLIASKCQGINVFINIGIICRMSIIDSTTSTTILDSDTGPGTCLQNKFMHNLDKIEKFDRDGTFAAQGKVEGDCLNRLASSPWFLKNGPKQASFNQFDELLNDLALNELPLADRLATITALTARTAYDFYRQTSNQEKPPLSIYISGGGSNNLTLMEYLSTYFAPLPVLNIETLGIPHDMRIPLALALTVDTFIAGTTVNWETGNCPKIGPLGRWFIP